MPVTDSKRTLTRSRFLLTIMLVLALVAAPFIQASTASAAPLTNTLVRFNRIKISSPTTGTVCAKPATASAETRVDVTFPNSYTLGVFGTFVVDTTVTTGWPVNGVAWTGIGTATAVNSQTVTFPSGDLVLNSNIYCFNWTNSAAVTTQGSASALNIGSVTTYVGASPLDTAQYATPTITDDQIAVTATVQSIFSFALSTNADALGILNSAIINTSSPGTTATVSTNATNGWMVWARDTNGSLSSVSTGDSISTTSVGANATLVAGTRGYNTGVTAGSVGAGAAATPSAAYIGTGSGQGGGLDSTLRMVASATAPSHLATMLIKNNVTLNSTVLAASDYTDTITVVGGGLF